MKLVVFSHKLFRRTPNGLQTNGAFTTQMDALAVHFDEVILCVPVMNDPNFQGVSVSNSNISFSPLPHYMGRVGFVRVMPMLRKKILAATKQADIGLVILPGYFGAYASWLCQKQKFPIFQWMVSDWQQNVQTRRSNILTQKLIAVLTPVLDWTMKHLTRNILTFFNGYILYHPPQPHHHIRFSSSIHTKNLVSTLETKQSTLQRPYQLLFVGRLSPEKGIIYLLYAIYQLISSNEDAVLHIVGDGELASKLKQEVALLSIEDRVKFYGFVPQGDKLRHIYRQSDLFILPALQDQQPKVLTEAMSQGVPVIATQTGGIPTIIKDGETGILIPPAQPDAIVTAIRRILADNTLRNHIIQQGLSFAREHTVESETEKMMYIITNHFNLSEHLT